MDNIILLLDANTNGLIALGVAILSGGLLLGIAAFRKAKPEMAKITVEVAGQAVIVQKGVIDSLQQELIRLGADLRMVEIENEKLITELRNLRAENDKCQRENDEFRRVVYELEVKLKNHMVRMDKIEENNEAKK